MTVPSLNVSGCFHSYPGTREAMLALEESAHFKISSRISNPERNCAIIKASCALYQSYSCLCKWNALQILSVWDRESHQLQFPETYSNGDMCGEFFLSFPSILRSRLAGVQYSSICERALRGGMWTARPPGRDVTQGLARGILTLKRKMTWSAGCLGWNRPAPSLLVPRKCNCLIFL